ncbi:hypothetical protein [Burkholderia sp. SIMBA_062]|uniref:hypothetical protein n=1 Tax=Burkholderia sp. SIMBA_062 TaxID=3085803 RepID=UPI00397AD705
MPTPQMVAMQQMMALQHVALGNAFAMPLWAMPEPVAAIAPPPRHSVLSTD